MTTSSDLMKLPKHERAVAKAMLEIREATDPTTALAKLAEERGEGILARHRSKQYREFVAAMKTERDALKLASEVEALHGEQNDVETLREDNAGLRQANESLKQELELVRDRLAAVTEHATAEPAMAVSSKGTGR